MLTKSPDLTPGALEEVREFNGDMPSPEAVIAMTRKSDMFCESGGFFIQVAPGVCVCYCCTWCWIIPLLANMWYLVNAIWSDTKQCTVQASNKGQQWHCGGCIHGYTCMDRVFRIIYFSKECWGDNFYFSSAHRSSKQQTMPLTIRRSPILGRAHTRLRTSSSNCAS